MSLAQLLFRVCTSRCTCGNRCYGRFWPPHEAETSSFPPTCPIGCSRRTVAGSHETWDQRRPPQLKKSADLSTRRVGTQRRFSFIADADRDRRELLPKCESNLCIELCPRMKCPVLLFIDDSSEYRCNQDGFESIEIVENRINKVARIKNKN